MRKTHASLLLSAAFGLSAGMTGVSAASASASTSTLCRAEVLSLTSHEPQDQDNRDEIKFKLGDDTYGTFTFPDDWTRNASLGSPTEDFNGASVRFEIWDVDGVVKTTIDTDFLSCTVGTHTDDLSGAGAIYELVYRITK